MRSADFRHFAAIAERRLEVERVLGIEYIADVQIAGANQIVVSDVDCRV
jgi:hypothetical protein